MILDLFADNAATTLTSSPSSSATSFTVASSSLFPAASNAAVPATQFRVLIGTELVTVTNVSGTTWTCNPLAAGHTSGDAVTHVVTAASLASMQIPTNLLAPAGADYETFPRNSYGNNSVTAPSGTLLLTAIALPAGLSVGHIAYRNGGTAAGTPTNWWFGLFDQDRVQLATTANQGTAAWAGSTQKSLAIANTAAGAATEFVTTYAGLYYVGFMMTAATLPNLLATTALSALMNQPPIMHGTSSTGQTSPPSFPFTAGAISATNGVPYAWVGV